MYIVVNSDVLLKLNYFYVIKIIDLVLNFIFGIIFIFVFKICYFRYFFMLNFIVFFLLGKFVFFFIFFVWGCVICGKKGVFVKVIRFLIDF